MTHGYAVLQRAERKARDARREAKIVSGWQRLSRWFELQLNSWEGGS